MKIEDVKTPSNCPGYGLIAKCGVDLRLGGVSQYSIYFSHGTLLGARISQIDGQAFMT